MAAGGKYRDKIIKIRMQRCRGKIHRCILLFFGGDKKARDKVELVRGDACIVP